MFKVSGITGNVCYVSLDSKNLAAVDFASLLAFQETGSSGPNPLRVGTTIVLLQLSSVHHFEPGRTEGAELDPTNATVELSS